MDLRQTVSISDLRQQLIPAVKPHSTTDEIQCSFSVAEFDEKDSPTWAEIECSNLPSNMPELGEFNLKFYDTKDGMDITNNKCHFLQIFLRDIVKSSA